MNTVRGPVDASDLGTTLMHEHIFIDLLREYRGDGWLSDGAAAVDELMSYRNAGGKTLVELTLRGMGRQTTALKDVSEKTGLQIVVGTGLYRLPYYDLEWVDQNGVDEIAAWMISEIEEGIVDTGIRAGIIGEIGCDEHLSSREERVFRAAARAHSRTGAAISTHAARWPVGHTQLDVLASESADLRAVIIGHADSVSSPNWFSEADAYAYHESLAARGAFVAFDHFGGWASPRDDERAIGGVLNLVRKGYLTQVLVSHDGSFKSHLHRHGGNGYDYILTTIAPEFEKRGLSHEELQVILVENPRRALAGAT